MDVTKGKEKKKNFFIKAWEKCQSIRGGGDHVKSPSYPSGKFSKSKSCHVQVAPEGCFSVYVGPERQRFVIKTKFANHPLFKMVLEDAETEYGFNCEGPLLLPCEVDLFYKPIQPVSSSGEGKYGPGLWIIWAFDSVSIA
ncbi:hypothetical protein C3L33_14474, partial [Rhododendron williamsianum]